MGVVKLQIDEERTAFFPSETITGMAGWDLERPPKRVEIRLFWYTSGKGTRDVEVVQTIPFEKPPQRHAERFEMKLPEAPYSFSGRLITLLWAIELVAEPTDETDRIEIVISPTAEEIRIAKSWDDEEDEEDEEA